MLTEQIKNYIQIIQKLQNASSTGPDYYFIELKQKLKDIGKNEICFDSNIVKAINIKLDRQFQLFYYENSFVKTLEFYRQFQKKLIQKRFISYRINLQLEKKIQRYQNDIQYKFYGNLDYLRLAKDRRQFRDDFFYRYCSKDDDQTQQWDQEDYRQNYCYFWLQLLNKKPNKKLINFIYSCFIKFENQSQMLSLQVRNNIEQIIGQDIGKNDIQIQLNKELKSIAIQNMYENSAQTKQKVNKQYQLILNLLNKLAGSTKCNQSKLELHLAKFGSLVSGFASGDADLDVTILTNCYVKQTNFLNYVNDYLKIQFGQIDKKTGQTTKVQFIPGKTPLVQVMMKDNRRQQQFKIDIIVNNVLGVMNSTLLNVYSSVHWVKHLGILIKLWAKAKGLITKMLLSSYSIINLMIHFLIFKKLVNIIYDARNRSTSTPYFQYKRVKEDQLQTFKVYYQFQTQLEKVTSFKNVSLFTILKQFMFFYSRQGNHWKKNNGKNIISIDGSYDKQFEQNYVFTIKDPFDKPHNPGRAPVTNKDFFLDTFNVGYQQLIRLQQTKDKNIRCKLLTNLFEKK